MAAKSKKPNTVPKVRLNDAAKAKDAELAEMQKQDRAAERKARKEREQVLPGATARKYSKDVEAAIAAHAFAQANPTIHRPYTPIVEKELDIVASAKGLDEYQSDPKKGGHLNQYFIDLYTKNLEILEAELAVLLKAAAKK